MQVYTDEVLFIYMYFIVLPINNAKGYVRYNPVSKLKHGNKFRSGLWSITRREARYVIINIID